MMRIFYFIALCSVSLGLSAQSVDTAALNVAFKQAQQKYAPDKRSVYLTMQYRRDSILFESSSAESLTALNTSVKAFPGLKVGFHVLPSPNLKGMVYGVANLSVCNNRAAPQNAAELVTQMILGTPVEILKRQGGYFLVRTPDGYLSWTDGAAVAEMHQADFDIWRAAEKVVFLNDFGHAFSAPDAGSLRVSDLVSGNILKLTGASGQFYKVEFPDKRIGFIPKSAARLYSKWKTEPLPLANSILASATKFIGAPYLWGGTSAKGMDCSGFTKTAYFLNGIIIPRDASQQALVGEVVEVMTTDTLDLEKSLKNLLPGDLLFFSAAKRRGVNGGKITHTAIYMGQGEFIQSAGMVKISSMRPDAVNYDSGQVPTIVGARRILNSIGQPEIVKVSEHPWYGN